jgi:hypothetical protein
MVKGFALDDERLADPERFGKDYFDELLSRIRAIRASEKRLYQAVRDIDATSVDYDPHDEKTLEFYKSVQKKMHYAISGHTAAEIVYSRSDAAKLGPLFTLAFAAGRFPCRWRLTSFSEWRSAGRSWR